MAHLFPLFLIVIIYLISQVNSIVYPRIEIQSWVTTFEDEVDEERGYRGHSWGWEANNLTHLLQTGLLAVIRQDEYLTYVVSQHIERLRISCTAPYPVSWVSPQDPLHPDAMYTYVYGIYDRRIAKNVRDPTTFTYVSTLEIYDSSGLATRNYSCQSLGHANDNQSILERNLYIYWEGNTYLVYAGEVLDVRTTNDETIVLPCKVSRPDVSVYLFKETPRGYEELLQNSSIKYHPITGYTIQLKELADPYGRYECISEDDSDSDELDSVKLNVLRGTQKPSMSPLAFNQTITSNATLHFDADREEIICCSSSSKPPNLRIVYCRNELSCKMKEHLLYKIGSKPPKINTLNGSCTTYEVYPRESGILRCKGDGIDVFHHYFTGLKTPDENRTFLTYFKRNDAVPEDLISLTSTFKDYHLYSGQNFTVNCDVSDYYFIRGLQWAIIWKNNSIQFLDEATYNPLYSNQSRNEPYADFDTAQVLAQYDMYSITCYAPVWNGSNYWTKKELVLDVQESILPTLTMVESITWNLNDTNQKLECGIDGGSPKPFVKWRKNNKSIIHDSNIYMTRANGTSILRFHYVSYESQGNYTCIAINYAGVALKTVTLHVRQNPNGPSSGSSSSSNSSTAGFFIFFITALLVGLFIGIGLLAWKLKMQKSIIEHLTGVVFRDVPREENGTTATNMNAIMSGSTGIGTQQQIPSSRHSRI